jgi:hypothetical protein
MKIYEGKFIKNKISEFSKISKVGTKNLLPSIEGFQSVKNHLSKKKTFFTTISNINDGSTERKKSPPKKKYSTNVSGLNSAVKGNLFLIYKDNSNKWVYDYEIKKLLFYFKFLPDHKNIRMIRIFPLHFTKLELRYQSYVDKEDEFAEIKEEGHKKNHSQMRNDLMFLRLVETIKNKFYERYNLVLRTLDIEIFELEGVSYLHEVKHMKFEKYENKHIKLITERKLLNFRDKFQYKNLKIQKEAPNHREVKKFFHTMLDVYENTKKHCKLNQYLHIAPRDPVSDEVFKDIKPNCPYTFSDLMNDSISKKEFKKWVSTKNWNED